jgi:hypothetical protein
MCTVCRAAGLALLSLSPIKAALARDRVSSANDVRATNERLAFALRLAVQIYWRAEELLSSP